MSAYRRSMEMNRADNAFGCYAMLNILTLEILIHARPIEELLQDAEATYAEASALKLQKPGDIWVWVQEGMLAPSALCYHVFRVTVRQVPPLLCSDLSIRFIFRGRACAALLAERPDCGTGSSGQVIARNAHIWREQTDPAIHCGSVVSISLPCVSSAPCLHTSASIVNEPRASPEWPPGFQILYPENNDDTRQRAPP